MDRIRVFTRKIDEKNGIYTEAEKDGLKVLAVKEDTCSMSAGSGSRFEGAAPAVPVNIKITNCSEQDFRGVVHIKLTGSFTNPKFFMPGYMYNRNTADMPGSGRKKFPRLCINGNECPESPYFLTRSDRLAAPVSLIYEDGRVLGISGAPVLSGNSVVSGTGIAPKEKSGFVFSGFSCAVEENGKASAGYTLGYENAPWLFVQTATVKERAPISEKSSILIKRGETLSITVYLYDYHAEDETGIYDALKDVYERFHEPPREIEGMDAKKGTQLLAGAIRDYAFIPEDRAYTGFVYDKDNKITYNKIGSLSWTNGLTVAVPQLMAANRLKDEVMRQQALTVIEETVLHSKNPDSGLLYDALDNGKWHVRGWWYSGMHSGGHSSYINGQAVYYILKAYRDENKYHGILPVKDFWENRTDAKMRENERNKLPLHTDWIDFVRPVIYTLNSHFNAENEYPFSFSEKTGAGLEYDSLGGAWALAATVFYMELTGDTRLLEQAKVSEEHYYTKFIRKAECYGGPLDTDKAVDNEGILAYIRAVRYLHVITGEEKYLDRLRDALYYEFSFKLLYNTRIQVKPLSEIGWSSCGGSITSVANPHIHPMSSTIIEEMNYYLSKREDEYTRSRTEDTIKWSLQTFNTYDGEYGHGKTGWMSERFCFCEGLVTEKYPDETPASTWFCLMGWASGSIIEGLCDLFD